jgi:hypothetical protein
MFSSLVGGQGWLMIPPGCLVVGRQRTHRYRFHSGTPKANCLTLARRLASGGLSSRSTDSFRRHRRDVLPESPLMQLGPPQVDHSAAVVIEDPRPDRPLVALAATGELRRCPSVTDSHPKNQRPQAAPANRAPAEPMS